MPMRILFSVTDSEATGCQRLIYPLMALKEKYGIEYEVLNSYDSKVQIRKADLVWLQCLIGPQQRDLLDYCKKQGVKVICDYDDFFPGVPKNIQERLGMTTDELTQNWHYYLQNVDLITVPCHTLAREVTRVTCKPVIVLPNLIQRSTYESFKDYKPYDDISELRILYSCSESHLQDFQFLTPILSWIGTLFPKVRILTNGKLNFTYYDPHFKGKASHINRVSYGAYYKTLMQYQPHIFLAPLLDNTYNQCRSDLKYQQAALLKCAFLGSDIETYKPTLGFSPGVEHGVTGLLTNNYKVSWLWNLRKLIKDSEAAKKMGEKAYTELGQRLLEDHIHLWYETFTGLLA
jgi:processive 1,2-diacylglycerol beta-glucosyltransferase